MTQKAVVLFSGGIDSTTIMALVKKEGSAIYALSFDYGQRHAVELEKAKESARQFGVARHLVIPLNLSQIGGSALTSPAIPVPKDIHAEAIGGTIPPTYVPARNTIFLSYALAWAEVLEVQDIFIGVNAIDYSGYPDCRSEYIHAYENMANLGTKTGVEGKLRFRIRTPLIGLTKAEIIKTGLALGVDYSISHSCYDPFPDGKACGRCESCRLRLQGFKAAGVDDPGAYG
ncbi:MAG: 7-cyano-7-deazaguanine synthase QueC [Deltaproteobacteria bacterium]|nr:7-cyano-7-deazaguanine synthase QueC [Deltaproteobacteria bacterium]